MNKRLQAILDLLQQSGSLTPEEKKSLADAVKESDKEITITEFKLERTEKVKRTTAILLEETIAELEQKRKSVEAQNRELEIEAALERVRGSAMAMHNSNDISVTTSIVFTELQKLGTQSIRCGVGLLSKDSHMAQVYAATTSSDGEFHTLMRTISMTEHSSLAQQYETWLKQENYQTVLKGEDLKSYYNLPFFHSSASYAPPEHYDQKEYGYYFPFPEGLFYAWTETPYSESELNILNRFKTIIALTFRRYLDLKKAESQARESQIQLALERVRARTMAMQRSEQLTDTAALLFQQIKELGIHQWGNSFQLWDDDMKAITAWTCTQGVEVQKFNIPTTGDPVMINIVNAAQKGEILHVEEMGGEALEEHYKFMYSLPVFKKILDNLAATGITPPKSQVMYAAYFSSGYILFITHEPNPEAHDIFKRFAKVFDQTYTRFLDLQKAEAQAREAMIEAALEKVRSRSMGMQKSEELKEVIQVVYEQFVHLNILIEHTGFIMDYKKRDDMNIWLADRHEVPSQITIPYFDSPHWNSFIKAKEKGRDFFANHLTFEEKNKFYQDLFKLIPELPDETKEYYFSCPGLAISTVLLENIGLYIENFSGIPYSDDENSTLMRFGKVFQQTYTRFLDLQKAEAQAREAQIEAALEKVRSRTLAMHTAHELGEVVLVIVEKLKELGVVLDANGVILCTYFQNSKNILHWIASPDFSFAGSYLLPYFDHPIFKDAWESKMSGADYFSKSFSVEEKNSFFEYAFEHSDYKYFPDEFKQWVFQNDKHLLSFAWQKNSAILIPSHTGIVPGEGDKEILKRFSKVFEQAYIRFLDLQKAEAQAREAQIEAALERVRSRAMAMQTSEELNALIGTVFTELTKLDLVLTRCVIMTYDHKTNDARWWMANSEAPEQPMNFHVQYHEHPPNLAYFSAWREQRVKWIYTLEGNVKKEWDDFIFSETELRLLPDFVIAGMKAPERVYLNVSFYNSGNLTLASLDPLSDEHFDILIRFAKVFDLTYTRFNDLKQAEAQAREAKIEAALERVRSRTMAMQRSEELVDVASILFQQVKALGVPQWNCGFNIWEIGDKEFTYYPGSPDGKILPSPCKIPLTEHPVFISFDESRKRGDELFVYEKEGEYQAEHYRYMRSLPGVGDLLQSMLDAGFQFPTFQIDHVANFAYGNLIFITYEHFPEMHDVFKRFAKVFEQTYTRFLDLQKAEAQAREAQIEAALEKVRSRSLAMHKAEELGEVITVVFDKLKDLNFSVGDGVALITFIEGSRDLNEWMANPGFSSATRFYLPYFEHPVLSNLWNAKNQGKEFLEGRYTAEENRSFLNHIFEYSDYKHTPQEIKDFCLAAGFYNNSIVFQKNTAIFINDYAGHSLSKHEIDILKRVSKVFEQTYTRFLDLQKAEAQAREAQIEAALEKVRSRSLAMHKSDEVGFVVDELFLRMKDLEIGFDSVNILEFTEDAFQVWAAYKPGKFTVTKIPFSKSDIPYVRGAVEAKNSGLKLFTHQYSFEEKNLFLKYLFDETHLKNLPDERKQFLLQCPCYTVSIGFAKNTAIQLQSYSRPAFSESENTILNRFVNVFEQAYTRFLDLQQAEGQAREAQIQLALERVRARTMAMQHSNELRDAASLLFQQIKDLGIDAWTCGYNIWDEDRKAATAWLSRGVMQPPFKVPLTENKTLMHFNEAAQRGESLFVEEVSGETLIELYRYLGTLLVSGGVSDEIRKPGYAPPTFQVNNVAYFSYGYLLFVTYKHYPEAHDIFKRFAKVFEQTYTRFLDLQKAEAQAREAKIETALERVRSRTMAMQHSSELTEISFLLIKQVLGLGIKTWGCAFNIFDEDQPSSTEWFSNEQGYKSTYKIPREGVFLKYYDAAQRGASLHVEEFTGAACIEHYKYLSTLPGLEDEMKIYAEHGVPLPTSQFDNVTYFKYGYLLFVTYENVPEAHDIFKRFAKVFEQTYTRFLDLQKAEAQTREAQIEASLERVRSKAMAMHKSEDLTAAVAVVFDELDKLDQGMSRCGIGILNKEKRSADVWTTSKSEGQNTVDVSGDESMDIHPLLQKAFDAWLRQEDLNYVLQGEDLADYYRALQHTNFRLPESEAMVTNAEMLHHHYYMASFQAGGLYAFRENPFTDEAKNVMKRFANVFSLTYKRFQDILKAEAQARESQIEAALERVRSRTMAMHRSEEIAEIVGKIFKELTVLDVALNRVLIWIFNHDEKFIRWWSANPESENNAESYRVDYFAHPVFLTYFEAWQKRSPLLLYTLGDDLKVSWEDHLFKNTELSRLPKAVQDGMRSEKKIFTTSAIGDFGLLMAGCFEPFSDEVNDIIQRFGRVFQQSYTRYLDVQKAEAQAREATIEASLEKVRGKAMAMHNSNDLTATASLVFTELRKLGIDSLRSGVGLLTRENRNIKLYSATSSEEGGSFSLVGWAVLDNHPALSKMYDSWINKEDYYPLLKGETLKSYYENILATFTVPVEQSEGYEQHGYFLPFSEGLFYGWSEKPYTETEIKILHRFRGIVDLTFRRYMELEKSESIAKEAIRQASLDRVRAEIASMRTTTDLDRITPLIWKELNILNIPFVRCGVFIMDDFQHLIHTFLSTPEGKAIAAFHLPYETPGNIGDLLSHWKTNQMYISHWDATAFSELGELLVQQGAIPSKEVYMNTVPPGGIHLHCLPFMQGMLYVGNTTQLQESDIHLIQSVADAFSTAYARYEDFNKLESAKAQIEKTLTDLKQTQNLLVQSEKMASLGELTAGIAHEIQNPLNFVNNFSEVSNELLEEMKEEIEKGNYDEVQAITNNVKQNLEKILHHGKRADGIVKGMLQHSRTSGVVKEQTNINTLADEYLRLAYHGLRAKDKSFNITVKTDFEENLESINVIPQDIGRVILNLITNAFYATKQRKQQEPELEPAVTLRTKKFGERVLIAVKDNGTGIPQKVLDKIFQPFFTTKPVGQGTGLGLSLSYDIVKAHGGEINVETKHGEGSEFIIQLPIV